MASDPAEAEQYTIWQTVLTPNFVHIGMRIQNDLLCPAPYTLILTKRAEKLKKEAQNTVQLNI